jgi:putative ABC transport system substrate-binding protein
MIGRSESKVRKSLNAIAMAFLALWCVSPETASGQSNWFQRKADVDFNWIVKVAPDDPMQVSVQRKNALRLASPQQVLVLYPRPSSAYDIAISKILNVFDGKELNVEITIINFEMRDARAENALRFAEKNDFSLIVAMGSESTAWLYNHYRGGRIPVVSVCAKDPVQLGEARDYKSGNGSNIAFTSLNMQVDVQMAYVLKLKPDLRNLAILVDGQNVSAVQTQAEPIAAYAAQKNVQVIRGVVQNSANAREELVQIVRGAVEAMRKTDPDLSKSLFWITGSTSVFREIRTINENAERVPVVSVIPEIVSQGEDTAVLAIGISFESNAHLAAIYAADILSGAVRASELAVGIVSPPDIAISFLKAREIGLRIPFEFLESASFVYDYRGQPVRKVEDNSARN